MKKILSLALAVGLIVLSEPVRAVSVTGFGVSNPTSAPMPVEIKSSAASPTPLPVQVQGGVTVNPGPTDSAGIPYEHPTSLPNPLPVTTAPPGIVVDGAPATGVSQDTGGSGTIGWLSSTVKNIRLIVTAVQGTLAVQVQAGTAVIGHVITDTGSVVNATLQASTAVIGHVIVDSGTVILGAGAATIGSIANTTFAVTQATGANLHAVLDASTAVIGHVVVDSGTIILGAGSAVIGHVITDAGSVVNATLQASSAVIGHVLVDSLPGPTSGTILTSSSATTCTNLQATSGKGVEITNSGPATTVYLQIYNDASNACAAGTLLYGDGSTLTLGAGQIVKIDYPVAGIAYKLSGSLTSNVAITGL